jgi:hypothetical protein
MRAHGWIILRERLHERPGPDLPFCCMSVGSRFGFSRIFATCPVSNHLIHSL